MASSGRDKQINQVKSARVMCDSPHAQVHARPLSALLLLLPLGCCWAVALTFDFEVDER
jgi:hypothetical protein